MEWLFVSLLDYLCSRNLLLFWRRNFFNPELAFWIVFGSNCQSPVFTDCFLFLCMIHGMQIFVVFISAVFITTFVEIICSNVLSLKHVKSVLDTGFILIDHSIFCKYFKWGTTICTSRKLSCSWIFVV